MDRMNTNGSMMGPFQVSALSEKPFSGGAHPVGSMFILSRIYQPARRVLRRRKSRTMDCPRVIVLVK